MTPRQTRIIRVFAAAWLVAVAFGILTSSSSAAAQDTDAWEAVVSRFATSSGVRYEALRGDAEARAQLNRYVESVGRMPERAPLFAWLNAYNALVVHSVVEHGPVDSVRTIEGFFDRRTHRVAGRMRTLDQVENEVIRPRFRDARVHVALNCGAVSCPPLHQHAFRQSTLDATLTRLARQVVASSRYVRVDSGRLRVSEIFHWFEEDFRRDAGSILAWLKRYDARDRLEGVPDDAEIGRLMYDWALNRAGD